MTARSKPRIKEDPALARATSKILTLQSAPMFASEWKLTWETFKGYVKHEQVDMAYTRIASPEAMKKAKYVARIARWAYRGRKLPEGREWTYLQHAMEVVYRDAGVGAVNSNTSQRMAASQSIPKMEEGK